MPAIATRHKLIKKIKDEKFDEEKLQRYILLIQIGAKDLQTGVVDSEDNRLIFFEDYVFSQVNSQEELFEALRELFDSHENLGAGFWKEVRISVKNSKFIQVPASLFVDTAAEDYLRFNAALDGEKENVLTCRNKKTDTVTIFSFQKEMYEWLKKVYAQTTVHFFHQSAALIEGVLYNAHTGSTPPLYVYVDRFKLHVLHIMGGKLIYYNQFLIKQFSDYVKYIMLVMKAMGMDQQSSKVMLWGYIGKNSPHYQEFAKYVRNVSFGLRPAHLRFGYLFDEVQEHHFFDLYSLNLLSA